MLQKSAGVGGGNSSRMSLSMQIFCSVCTCQPRWHADFFADRFAATSIFSQNRCGGRAWRYIYAACALLTYLTELILCCYVNRTNVSPPLKLVISPATSPCSTVLYTNTPIFLLVDRHVCDCRTTHVCHLLPV